jgi:hypothetical protein
MSLDISQYAFHGQTLITPDVDGNGVALSEVQHEVAQITYEEARDFIVGKVTCTSRPLAGNQLGCSEVISIVYVFSAEELHDFIKQVKAS